jgi:hypothetical protein
VSPGSVARALPGLEKEPDDLLEDVRAALTHSRRNAAALAIADDADHGREVRERMDRLERERSDTRSWQRKRRADLDDLITRQREALERWVPAPRPRFCSVARPPAHDRPAIATTILDPPPAIEQRIGPRPSAIGDREQWMRAAAQLARSAPHALELDPTGPERTMDYDTGLEL